MSDFTGVTGKEIYERRKRMKAERLLREEEAGYRRSIEAEDSDVLIAAMVYAFERIADAMERIAEKLPSSGTPESSHD